MEYDTIWHLFMFNERPFKVHHLLNVVKYFCRSKFWSTFTNFCVIFFYQNKIILELSMENTASLINKLKKSGKWSYWGTLEVAYVGIDIKFLNFNNWVRRQKNKLIHYKKGLTKSILPRFKLIVHNWCYNKRPFESQCWQHQRFVDH